MDDSTAIELGILAVLVFVVSHPVAPVVNTSVTVNNIPPPEQRSGADASLISSIANDVVSVIGAIAKVIP